MNYKFFFISPCIKIKLKQKNLIEYLGICKLVFDFKYKNFENVFKILGPIIFPKY